MQARPEKARKFGLRGIEAALDGITGTTAIHICFGYAAIIHVRPQDYSFLRELAGSPVDQKMCAMVEGAGIVRRELTAS
jgi:5-methyltetrahydropteroyltriglutamate--homocysteine methyltransferase